MALWLGFTMLSSGTAQAVTAAPTPSNNRTFSGASNPNSDLYSGSGSGVSVTNVSNWPSTMTADLSSNGIVLGPTNDDFVDATELAGPTDSRTGDTNVGATKEAGEPNHARDPGGASVWYSWTAPATGPVTIETAGSSFDTTLGTYTGSAVNALSVVAQDDDSGPGSTSHLTFDAQSGATYQIAVDGFNGATGSVDLQVQMGSLVRPGNDDFTNATELTGSSTSVTGDTNLDATRETGEPQITGNTGGASVWYSWAAPATGPVTIDTAGSDFDTVLGAYTGSAVNALSLVAEDDDGGLGTTSQVTFNAQSGTSYKIAVDGFNGAAGSLNLQVVGPAPPVSPPQNDFNGDGRSDLAWRNSATGEDYLWFMNGTQLGSSGPTLTLADQAWKVAETGDLNGDAKADLVWRNSSTGEVYVWLMNGTTVASHGSVFTLADQNWKLVGTGDFNGNGTDDLLWRNAVTGENYVWFMNGTTLASSGPTPHPVGPFLEGRGHRGLQRRWQDRHRLAERLGPGLRLADGRDEPRLPRGGLHSGRSELAGPGHRGLRRQRQRRPAVAERGHG